MASVFKMDTITIKDLNDFVIKKEAIVAALKNKYKINDNNKLCGYLISNILMEVYNNSWLHQNELKSLSEEDLKDLVKSYKVNMLTYLMLATFVSNSSFYSVFSTIKPSNPTSTDTLFKILHGLMFTPQYILNNKDLITRTFETLAWDLKKDGFGADYFKEVHDKVKELKLI